MSNAARLKTFVSVFALFPLMSLAPAGHAAPAADDAARCQALSGKTIAPNMKLLTAEYDADGATVGRTKVDIPMCRIVGEATPTTDSRIGFEVWLPPASSWNGKFQGEGSGASAGAISPGPMLTALKAGYATMSTDNGHITDPDAPNGASEQGWALGHPEKMVDFAYRALHVSTVAAKNIMQRFYGRKARESYFVGCSQGGHHALMEATRFPADYDGIVAGAPAWHWANQMINATWNSRAAMLDPAALTQESATLLNRKVIEACDALDGVKDGVIEDPRQCHFDPASLQCKEGDAAGECLTPAQVAAANAIYSGAKKSDGTPIFQGYAPGSEAEWARVWGGKAPGGSAFDFFRYSVFQDKNFKNTDFDYDKDTDRALSAKVVGKETVGDVYNVKPDLTRFAAMGHKLIMYHGWADQQISPYASLDFYRQIVAKLGQAKADAFMRLYMLPGIYHCVGGPGTGNFGAAGPASAPDAEHDITIALDQWVTAKKAPNQFIGTHIDTQTKMADRTRPICPWPEMAKYNGSGDTNDSANFTCAAPRS
ncbi:MAG TPA: tannase/feruloyl esterase family alpha/beta hydrolase [Rhizomicrobium sp.]|nr:tannase/feruloyl esterase family alpha/beta hydrolase [Rhizomicrobium sp.]